MALAVLQAAQQLAFLSPSFNQPIAPGQAVTVSWKSPYEFTNVEVLQGPDNNGLYSTDILAANATQDLNTLIWTANSAPGNDYSVPFLFRLQKGDSPNDCAVCTTSTSAFSVTDSNAPAAGVSSSGATIAQTTGMSAAASTPSAASTSSPASGSTEALSATSASAMTSVESSVAAATSASSAMETSMSSSGSSTAAAMSTSAAGMSSPAPSSSSAVSAAAASASSTSGYQQITEENYHPPSKETLAIGLGIGIPIGLLAIGMIAFLLWDKRRKQKKYASSAMGYDEQRRGEDIVDEQVHKPSRESQTSGWTSKHSHKTVSSYHSKFDFEEEEGSANESWLQEAVRAGRDTRM
ncbi:hypothetical protein DOTSEDRAFT_29463 [Dothistroma septosporum NZE10]|uniref:Mid2 domain-containing protein n=1 Tax=Dothistroma septosporum (strain NZE10 / CBS 128990) TaxID=675120 RepID=N1PBJ5_DOTSN|nr:hypothetical protein DOTSEDRAFT_29463 [Dothistroma septosporum NZE10]